MLTRRDGQHLLPVSPPSHAKTPTAHLPVRNAKVIRRVRKALAQNVTSRQIQSALAQPRQVRIRITVRGGSRVAGTDIPRAALPMPPLANEPAVSPAPVIRALPRRVQRPFITTRESSPPPMQLTTRPRVSSALFLGRMAAWLWLMARLLTGILSDVLRRRNSQPRRAARLRQAFERAGGTPVKIGLQLALHLDILPVGYCEELALMHDKMPPLATSDAIAIIERKTRKRLNETFSRFDPVAIDSSSVRCVYQAILRGTGEKVVVKVRRPGIDAEFDADLRVLMHLSRLAEALTLIHPGHAVEVCRELQKALRDELDFRRGARYSELFGRRARKAGLRFCATPRLYGELSSDEVQVQAFESGMWLWEVLAAIEQRDEKGLAYMRALNIDPKKLARRLLFVNNWAMFEHLTFQADPHPANIVVRANSKLVFIDSAVNGSITKPRRQLFQRFHACQAQADIWGMAQATVALIEPLPARDLNALAKKIEAAYYERLLALKSKHSLWHERSNVGMWLAAFKIMREYKIPAPVDVLLYVRATLLHDTLAARLYPAIDYFKEFKRYNRNAQKRRRARGTRRIRRRLREGLLTASDFMTFQTVATTANDLLFRLQRILAVPHDFAVVPLTIEKWVFVLITAIRFLAGSAALALAGVVLALSYNAATGQSLAIDASWQLVMTNGLFLIAIALLALLHVRLILFRLGDRGREG
jgi:ubiquinone biosynthesis protein